MAYSESSDVYSLGILINEIMSGSMPWSGGAREVDFMSWVVNKSMRPDMWTMSRSPTAAEKQLFASVGRSRKQCEAICRILFQRNIANCG